MNKQDRKYRFTEIITAVELLPEVDMSNNESEGSEDWVLPNLAKGLDDLKLREALLCQAFKSDSDEFAFKLLALLTNSAMTALRRSEGDDTLMGNQLQEALGALSVSTNILWARGQSTALLGLLGMVGQVCAHYEVTAPDMVKAMFKGNDTIHRFGKLDPYEIMENAVTVKKLTEVMNEGDDDDNLNGLADTLDKIIGEFRDKNKDSD